MNLSNDGLDLIKSFEGYLKPVNDGSGDCVAYLCPAKVPTIGWGCTKGVSLGMRWTRDEAERMLMSELSHHEGRVTRLVTVPIEQEHYDALVSFSYNCGSNALQKSTLLRNLNAGDYDGAEAQFKRWTRGGGRELRGLVRRRKAEAALFARGTAKLMEMDAEEPMPQAVAASPEPVSRPAVGATGLAAGGGAAIAVTEVVKDPHAIIAWKPVFEWGAAVPIVALFGVALAAAAFLPWGRWLDRKDAS